jgi:beta-lactamase class A
MRLLKILHEAKEGFQGVLGVAVKHLGTGEAAALDGDELFPSASIRKLPIIVELYRQVEAGAISLDEKFILSEANKGLGSGILKELSLGLEITFRDLAALMMILSDNTAADVILERVGRDNVNSTMRSLGLEKTKIVANSKEILFDLAGLGHLPKAEKTFETFRRMTRETTWRGSWSLGIDRNNVTTPIEMLRLLEMIVEGKAASQESCDTILETMSWCQTGGYRISKYLPHERVRVADKTGELPGIRNNVGVITLLDKGETYILSCFTKGAANNFEAEETIAKVSKNIYHCFSE